jgi:DNA-binding transcriptional MerR regulator
MEQTTETCLTSEAARILGLSPDGVRWLARRGVLHAEVTTGGVRLFTRREVERLADIRRRRAAALEAVHQERGRQGVRR